MSRPNVYDRKNQKVVRFRLNENVHKFFKIYSIQEDTTIQELFESFAMDIYNKMNPIKNGE
jgi:hypothetical protein